MTGVEVFDAGVVIKDDDGGNLRGAAWGGGVVQAGMPCVAVAVKG